MKKKSFLQKIFFHLSDFGVYRAISAPYFRSASFMVATMPIMVIFFVI